MKGYRTGPVPEPEIDPMVEFGGLALDAVARVNRELRTERAVSRFLAETMATEGKWTTEQWLDEARLAVERAELSEDEQREEDDA